MLRMKKYKYIITSIFLLATQLCSAQDTTKITINTDSIPVFHWDTTAIITFTSSCDYLLMRDSSKENYRFYKKHQKLISGDATEKNYSDYFYLACSLWNIHKTAEAESLFLKIVASDLPAYNITYKHSTDIPGDTTSNSYGYGSYSSHYKNTACLYLAKIYIEKEQFQMALTYVELADKKYIQYYSCGTGYMHYRYKIDGLYECCNEGLLK
jgi:hypothetical protein